MAMTFTPAVRGGRRWVGDVIVFGGAVLIGASVALLVVVMVVGALTYAVSESVARGLIVAVVATAVLRDLGVRSPVPYRGRQVPEHFRELLPRRALAATYGVVLGLGFATRFTFAAHTATWLALPFLSEPLQAAALPLYTLGKTLPLVAAAGARSSDDVDRRFRWSRNRERVLRGASATFAAVLALVIALA
jgi:hypothetical protein